MTKFKRVCISLNEELHKKMQQTAESMGMTLSSWIKFIARDKIGYFERNKDKYFITQPTVESTQPTVEEKNVTEEEFEKILDEYVNDRKR